MGTIVRLIETHRKSTNQAVVGCFNNLYKSVSEMGLESFKTESHKQILVYPRSVKHEKYTKIKLKLDDTEAVKYFVCPTPTCSSYCSLSNTDKCECGGLMYWQIQVLDQIEGWILRNNNDGVFFSCETSNTFIISDDLKVAPSTMDYVLKTVRGLGYSNTNKLSEIFLDVGLSEVLTMLECLFSSDSPLTDTFLKKQSSLLVTNFFIPRIPTVQGPRDQTITIKAFSKKLDGKLLCVECGADFIDLLFTFLALPLESVWKIISGDSLSTLGCIANLFKSFKTLNEGRDDSSSCSSKCMLPLCYSCPLLDVVTEKEKIYYGFLRNYADISNDGHFTRKMPERCLYYQGDMKLRDLFFLSIN